MITRLRALFADPNPILVKELRATFRANFYVRFLYLATGVVALIVLALGATIASNGVPPARVGQALFQIFLGATLLIISLVAPGYASAAITSEHEQQTWESLVLSGMSAWRIVFGKLAACYASIVLVLIAFSPVVGIAFLFGGVSPLSVAIGFASVLIALAPAVALGIAISARLRSTRIAIVLSTLVFVPLAFMGIGALGALSDEVRHSWGIGMEGPFFYTEALVTRANEWDTWGLLVGAPLYALGMPVWFLLASAVVGIRPAAEDRSKPVKVWAIAMAVSAIALASIFVGWLANRGHQGEVALLAVTLMSVLLIFFGLLFTNEPALPPRPWALAQEKRSPVARALGALGPGAAGTMRFAIALSFITAVALTAAVIATRHPSLLLFDARAHELVPDRYDVACMVLASGAFVVAAFTASLGAFLRLVLQSGIAARVLTAAILTAAVALPFVASLLVDPSSLGRLDRSTPLLVTASILEPFLLAVQLMERHQGLRGLVTLAVPLGLYGTLAIVFAAQVELRVRRAKKSAAARRARFAEPVA